MFTYVRTELTDRKISLKENFYRNIKPIYTLSWQKPCLYTVIQNCELGILCLILRLTLKEKEIKFDQNSDHDPLKNRYHLKNTKKKYTRIESNFILYKFYYLNTFEVFSELCQNSPLSWELQMLHVYLYIDLFLLRL